MLKVLLCDAAKDENGRDGYEGSIPGNQFKITGDPKFPDEVRTIDYRLVREFWQKNRETRVYRLKREDMANALGIRMKQSADNKHCGYSQLNRKGICDALTKDPDPSHIKDNIEMDCSSLVNSCLWVTFKTTKHSEAYKVYPLARTKEMPERYAHIDEMMDVTDMVDLSTGEGFMRGDILVIPNNHTAVIWDVTEEEEPEREYRKGIVQTKLYMRTGPGVLHQPCYVQTPPFYEYRCTLYKHEEVRIIGEDGNWYQLEMRGDVYTWYPWASKKYIKVEE